MRKLEVLQSFCYEVAFFFIIVIHKWGWQLPAQKQLSSSAPPGCYIACPSMVSALVTCLTSDHYVAGSAAAGVL